MTCDNLVKRMNEVSKCRLKAVYVVRDKDTKEIVENLCIIHARKVMQAGPIAPHLEIVGFYTKVK